MELISFEERIDRISETTHIVYIEDMTVHQVSSVEQLGKVVFVNTGTGLLFQDLDVFTLEEACDAERFLKITYNKIKIWLQITGIVAST